MSLEQEKLTARIKTRSFNDRTSEIPIRCYLSNKIAYRKLDTHTINKWNSDDTIMASESENPLPHKLKYRAYLMDILVGFSAID